MTHMNNDINKNTDVIEDELVMYVYSCIICVSIFVEAVCRFVAGIRV